MLAQTFVLCVIFGFCTANSQLITYEQFVDAVTLNHYPEPSQEKYEVFVTSVEPKGNITTKLEMAMALAQFLWESDGLQAKREYRCATNNCSGDYQTRNCDIPGQYYYGRGYIQLTWCFNYRAASKDLYGDDRLVQDPDLVAQSEQLSWDTAFWFWKTNVHNQKGVAEGKFGATTKAINGFLECRGKPMHGTIQRFQIYKRVMEGFGLDPETADETGCYN